MKKARRTSRKPAKPRYGLRLYVTGVTPRSTRAIATIKAVCEKNFPGRYNLEIIDLYQQPERAEKEQIIASPTLVREHPGPLRRFIGDITDSAKLVSSLKSS